jgi:FkbM family methyltransferase
MRTRLVSLVTRLYPLKSGCGLIANHPLTTFLAGDPHRDEWAPVQGGYLRVSLTDRVGRAAYYVGDFDRKVSDAIDVAVEPGDSVLDIGANVGLTALRLASRVGHRGAVRAFEPNPTMLRYLMESIQRSKVQDIVEVLPYALGRTNGKATLRVPSGNAGMGSLAQDCEDVAEEHVVDVVRLDDVWRQQRWPRIDFIKIDVEGFETNVLEGARQAIAAAKPRAILFEHHRASSLDVDRSPITILRELGYSVFALPRYLLFPRAVPADDRRAQGSDFIAIVDDHRGLAIRKSLRLASNARG